MTEYASQNAARRGYAARYAPDSAFPGILPTNAALDAIREVWDSGDPHGSSSEALYALHRVWNAYASPRIGTSPIDAWDAGDECPLADDIFSSVEDIPADSAADKIVHATRVAMRVDALIPDERRY